MAKGLFLIEDYKHTNMRTVIVLIEKGEDGKYWARTESELNGDTILNGCGDTAQAAKADIEKAYEEAKEDSQRNGMAFEDVKFEYKYDLQSFFDYFSVFNVNEVARRAGINPSLMRQYRGGFKKAGEQTYARLSACVDNIKRELQAARF